MAYQHIRLGVVVAALITSIFAANAWADGTSAPMLCWQNLWENKPCFSVWNGSSWPSPRNAASINDYTVWLALKNCPTRAEYAMATLDWSYDVNLQFHAAGTWTGLVKLCSNTGGSDTRCLDLAYEQTSGDLLIAYWNDASSGSLCYRSYSAPGSYVAGTLNLTGNKRVRWIKLIPKKDSDEIFLIALDEDQNLHAARWSGSGFGAASKLFNNCSSSGTECFDFAWESQSGRGLLVYGVSGSNQPSYRTWNGAWSSAGSLPTVGSSPRWLRLAADPASNQILFGSLDSSADVNVNVWNGAAWGSNSELETEACWTTVRAFDITYEPGGTKALIAYPDNLDSRVRYRRWNGSSWSGESWGPEMGLVPAIVQLVSGVNPGEIFLSVGDLFDELYTSRWNGSSFSSGHCEDSWLSGWGTECFMVATPASSTLLFTDVSAATGFNVQTTNSADHGSGLHCGDLNNDGFPDPVITGNQYSRLLLYNSGAGSYTVSNFGGGSIYCQGALLDIDNDGDLDFFGIPSPNEQRAFLNNGAGVFTDAGSLGFTGPTTNEGLAAGDLDGDGWCDVLMFSGNGNWIGFHQGTQTPQLVGANAASYGFNGVGAFGDGDYCSAADVNKDGYLDFFYQYNSGKLFVSNGNGAYTQNNYGISVATGQAAKIGSAWADYDNDGDLDLFVPRYDAGQPGYLWRNDVNWSASPPSNSFTNVAVAAGITDASGQRSACWGDYDNDGDLDLYVVTRGGAANILYQNQGPPYWNFIPVSVGAAAPGDGHDAVFFDYDNDGDLDLAVTQQGAANTLLRNGTNNTNYLKVRVIGHGAGGTNRAAIGTRVELWNAGGTTFLAQRQVGVARGFAGTEPIWLHFGGLNPASTYMLKTYFTGHPASEVYTTSVVPGSASTTIGSTTIFQMLTIEEPPSVKLIQWREKPNRGP